MPNKELLIVDCGDVLLDFNGALMLWHNKKYGTSYKRSDIIGYGLEDVWKCTKDDAIKRVFEFYHCFGHDTITPVSGAIDAVIKLRKKYDLMIATSRPPVVRVATATLIKRHFGPRFDGMHFLGHYHGAPRSISKGELCRDLKACRLIDDALFHAQVAEQTGIPVLLLDTPWNQGEVPSNTTRVRNWDHILELLL